MFFASSSWQGKLSLWPQFLFLKFVNYPSDPPSSENYELYKLPIFSENYSELSKWPPVFIMRSIKFSQWPTISKRILTGSRSLLLPAVYTQHSLSLAHGVPPHPRIHECQVLSGKGLCWGSGDLTRPTHHREWTLGWNNGTPI